MNLKNRQHD